MKVNIWVFLASLLSSIGFGSLSLGRRLLGGAFLFAACLAAGVVTERLRAAR